MQWNLKANILSQQTGLFLRCHMLFYLNLANLMIKENSENFMQMREL